MNERSISENFKPHSNDSRFVIYYKKNLMIDFVTQLRKETVKKMSEPNCPVGNNDIQRKHMEAKISIGILLAIQTHTTFNLARKKSP